MNISSGQKFSVNNHRITMHTIIWEAIYINKGLIDKAIAEYVEAVKYKPVFPQAYYNLGNACIKKGMVDDAIKFFGKAISQGMYNPQIFNNLGSAYMKKGT